MTLSLEIKKLKRTGYFPAFIGAGFIASAFPVINMLARAQTFTALSGDPLTILMDANWQMMAMINILICVCGSCIMYHTEYADNGLQKMDVLPVRSGALFITKFVITALILAIIIVMETAVLARCVLHWFPGRGLSLWELLKTAGFQWLITLPTVMMMLVIASAWKNMWISLGIGVILVFALSILPQDLLILNLCPFSSPYQTYAMAVQNDRVSLFLILCPVETAVLGLLEMFYQKIRRCVQ